MTKVIVADDHALVSAGLCRLLESKEDLEVLGEAASGWEAIKLCEELHPDVLLLDLDMPDIDGFEVTRRLAASQPEIKILILTMHDQEEYAIRLIQSGASGFIVKGSPPGELPDAIRKVAAGKVYISPLVMERMLVRQEKSSGETPLSMLSEREHQVLLRLSQGRGVNDISKELGLSTSTVGTYKKRIQSKLGLNNISDIVRFSMRVGLISRL